MAIDTAAKRKSAIGLALLALRLGVIPDASNLSSAQRLHVQGLYSGIAASGEAPPPATGAISATDVDNYIGGSAALSTVSGSATIGVLGGSVSGSVIGGSVS